MARRKQQSVKKRRKGSRAAAVAKRRAECADNHPNLPALHTPQEQPCQPRTDHSPPPSLVSETSGGSKRPSTYTDNNSNDIMGNTDIRSKKIRRRVGPTLLIPTTPLPPLAVCQPASLFAMLLVASLLPKNTFSLRWLALSGGGFGSGGKNTLNNCLVNNHRGCSSKLLFSDQKQDTRSSSWLAMALDPKCEDVIMEGAAEEEGRKVILALWNDVTASLAKTMSGSIASVSDTDDYRSQDWTIDSVLQIIPRGGGSGHGHDDQERETKSYAGLVNLGNTCYLNAQLQCAYHVPYLRQLVKNAKEKVVEVEVDVEVEVEVDDDDDAEGEKEEGGNEVLDENLALNCDSAEEGGTQAETIEAESVVPEQENDPEESREDDEPVQQPKKKTIIKKEMKEEIVPISNALQALKITFHSLTKSQRSSGSTSILCRTLGLNPYLQQDGQEFWKLFMPELDHDELGKLYSGYFEDYVREIVDDDVDPSLESESEMTEDEEEKKEEYSTLREEEGAVNKARERVRIEPFLDLSIPVAEGTGGSVESTLREMFTEPEILRESEGNGWRPSKGADKVDAFKGSSLKRAGLPSLLQLHLKRFKFDWETEETSKINDCCSFPLELDLSDISEADEGDKIVESDDAIYDLQSIVIHRGEYGSGHYYSYVRPDIRQNEWYRFDDELVTRVDYSDVIADAYGGSRRTRRKRSRTDSVELEGTGDNAPVKRQRRRQGLFQRIFSFFGLFRRVTTMIGSSNASGGGGGSFGYGGRSSNAYMIQYARRSDIPKLYLEEQAEQ
mmetsp:Transcript_1752/g.3749  ORF Transcript_1752/g.3749 Transcript_1752/m.3749 type:complete len:784 (-) Transcript_1752:58-2409(-)|eukprot:CAMPEP_0172313588 /NCGR_PEP_ID=MMETSP1058-20130122/20534_1 /TAXON_ID=83371 /ORGANISM="Detonula confervacea, Strain CCMP 353" /LENGTH=783 /DNA_ID=CAMNT_0013027265 /DNA_START=15 /DNA_END=2366 /DNA_ORIENTATION=+